MAQVFVFVAAIVFIRISPSNEKESGSLRTRLYKETIYREPTWFHVHSIKHNNIESFFNFLECARPHDAGHLQCAWRTSTPRRASIRLTIRGIELTASNTEPCFGDDLEIAVGYLENFQTRFCGRLTANEFLSKDTAKKVSSDGISISKKLSNKYRSLKSTTQKNIKNGIMEDASIQDYMIKPGNQPIHDLVKRQVSRNSKFKRLESGEDSPSGMSGLVIVGIVIGALLGFLVLVLILRRCLAKNKDEDKETQANSGMPRKRMTQDRPGNVKHNILSPNMVVHLKDSPFPLPIKRMPSQRSRKRPFSYEWEEDEAPPDYRKVITAGYDKKFTARNPSYRNGGGGGQAKGMAHSNGLGQLHHSPSRFERGRSSIRRKSSNEGSPLAWKISHRYTNSRTHGSDQRKAFEDFNNEKFVEYGNFSRSKSLPRAGHVISTRESAFFENHRGQRASSMRRISRKPSGSETRDEGGKSRGAFSPHLAVKRRSTVGGTRDKIVSRTEDFRRSTTRRSRQIDKNDFQTGNLMSARSTIEAASSSPILPRHVVPASRG